MYLIELYSTVYCVELSAVIQLYCTVLHFDELYRLYCVLDVLKYSIIILFFSYVLAVLNARNVVVEQLEIPLTTSGLMGLRCAQLVGKTGTKGIIVLCVRNVTRMKILSQR